MATIYENDKYLRLPYRKLFRKVKLHQVGNWEILDIIRYIFIKANYTDKIKDGKIYNDPIGEYYEDEYKESTKTIFNCISKYATSLFVNDQSELKTHYENIKIKTETIPIKGNNNNKEKIIKLYSSILILLLILMRVITNNKKLMEINIIIIIEQIQKILYLGFYNKKILIKIWR